MPIDPICGMVVPEEHAVACTDFRGKHFCFCSEDCKEEFDMEPEMYTFEREVSLEKEEVIW